MNQKVLPAFAALLATVAAPTIAHAFTAEVDKLQSRQLLADFQSNGYICEVSPGQTGGLITTTNIQWVDSIQTTQISSPPSVTTNHYGSIVLTVTYQDTCTGDNQIMVGYIIDPHTDPAVHVSQATDLSSGHVGAVIHVATDPDGQGTHDQADLTVNLNWAAIAAAATTTYKGTDNSGGVISTWNYATTVRPGRATGTVTGVLHLLSGDKTVNFTDVPSQQAPLIKVSNTDNIVRP